MSHLKLALLVVASATACFAQVTVLNGASNRVNQPLTFGSWATAYGAFPGVTTATTSSSVIPKTLGGVSVTVDGVEAPVYFVSATQINFLMPIRTTPGLRPVEIKTAGATHSGTVRVMAAAPGLFVKDAATLPKGAVLNQDSTENTESNPERRGRVIQIYATGPGALTGDIAEGAPAPSSPLVVTRSTPQVYIAGVPAEVQFTGMAPGFAGLWQINVFIPDQPFIRGRVPVQLFMDGVDSNEVGIFVSQ